MNDERPIEKLLRRAAKKRSDAAGAPPELHPANRRMLQDEVARQFPKAEAPRREAAPPFWVALTRRWAYALALLPVIGILAFVLVPSLSKSKSKSSLELAKNAPVELTMTPAVMADETLAGNSGSTTATFSDSAEPATFNAVGRSGGGNNADVRSFDSPPTLSLSPPLATPLTRTAGETSTRRERAVSPTVATGSLGVNRRNEGAVDRLEGRTDDLKQAKVTESFRRTAPATVAQSPSPTRSVSFGGTSQTPAGAVASSAAAPGLDAPKKTEEKSITNYYATGNKEFDTPTQVGLTVTDNAEVIATSESAKDNFLADKSWIARGGGEEKQRTTLNSQAYSNLDADQAKAKDLRAYRLPTPVLVNFKVEQAGRDLRIVDGDGSVYKGVVDEQNTLYKQISERQQQKLAIANDTKFNFQTPKQTDAVSALKKLEADNYYLYRVEGTNRTLNQNVVFTWNFVDTNTLANGNLNYQNVARKLDATKLPSQFPALLQNSYINGRAQFGEGREVEVNAVPVKP